MMDAFPNATTHPSRNQGSLLHGNVLSSQSNQDCTIDLDAAMSIAARACASAPAGSRHAGMYEQRLETARVR